MKNKIMKNALTRIFTTVKIQPNINDEVEIKEKVITSELLKNEEDQIYHLISSTNPLYWKIEIFVK